MSQSKIRLCTYILVNVLLFFLGIGVGSLLFSLDGTEQDKDVAAENIEKIVIQQNTYDKLEELTKLVDYAIQKYCDKKGKDNTYTYHIIENMLHHDIRIEDDDGYIFDLDKIVPSELLGDKFTFQIQGQENLIFVIINTYRMKMYVYEAESNPRIVEGETVERNVFDSELERIVQCDWPDMWPWEYNQFVIDGYEYLTTPSFDEMISVNPDLYGMVIYSIQRYCEENGLEEMFYFQFPDDLVTSVANRLFTVKVESENRMLYMDIDMNRNKVHIYQVQEDDK